MSIRGTVERRANAIQTRHRPLPSTTFQPTAEKGLAFGYATLDGASQIVDDQIPDDITRDTELDAAIDVAATTLTRGSVKVDNDSGGNPVALTSAGHGADADPHGQYQKESEKDANNGYLGADANARLASTRLTMSATDRLVGRQTASGGASEEVTCTAAGRALIDDASAGDQRTTLGLGALATKSTIATADIDDDATTFAKMQHIATATVLGRQTGGSGNVEEVPMTDQPTASTVAVRDASGGLDLVALDLGASQRAPVAVQRGAGAFGSTAAVTVWQGALASGHPQAYLVLVKGHLDANATGFYFADLVLFMTGAGAAVVIASTTVSAAARTYTISTNDLQLQLASGGANSYTATAVAIGLRSS